MPQFNNFCAMPNRQPDSWGVFSVSSSKIDKFHAVHSVEFLYIRHLAIEKVYSDELHTICNVELELLREPWLPRPRLSLTFLDAVDIKIGNINISGGLHLSIYDISDWQLERVRYRVVDDEAANDRASMCRF
jgi:hypothetical protein